MEFELKNPNENGLITENDFAELLLAYSGFRNNKRMKILKRVRRKYRDHSFGISKKDYLDFFRFLSNINDVHTALTFYHISGADIDPFTMKHVAKTVSQVDLRDHVIDVVFTLFDENRKCFSFFFIPIKFIYLRPKQNQIENPFFPFERRQIGNNREKTINLECHCT